ncbi:Asp23/Gls24 family envelope stress response protein [Micromonospora sp. GCM10011542]|uniref:Asp23/Gls24 family envelope stress response protein n=1 Tax=Micromonospora sp. GCM10011542 TaxID=3317337 RepID=UPI00361442D8
MTSRPGPGAAGHRGAGAQRPGADTLEQRVGRIAAEAAGAVRGVHDAQPVTVRLGDRAVGIDLRLVTRYGRSVPAVAEAVRAAVAGRVAAATGLAVAVVTVTVVDVLVPGVDPVPR